MQPSQTRAVLLRWIGPLIVLSVGIAMTAWTWMKYPDPEVDFGREIYVPWRLSEGAVLYRDMHHFNGPFSPYLHTLVFLIAGVSLRALVYFNLALVAAFTALLYRLMLQIGNHFSATVVCVSFLICSAMSHLTPWALFNFVAPYSYELPHGLMLAFVMVTLLWMYALSRKWIHVALAGVALGLVLLTKAEVQLSAAMVVAAALPLIFMAHGWEKGRSARDLVVFFAAAAAPVVVTLALLSQAMPPAQALGGLIGSWRWVGDERLTSLPFYRMVLGVDDVGATIRIIAEWSAYYLAAAAPATIIALLMRRHLPAEDGTQRRKTWSRFLGEERTWLGILAAAVVLVTLLWNWRDTEWSRILRPTPLLLLIGGVAMVVLIYQRRGNHDALLRMVLPFMLTVLAGGMIAKIVLNVRPYHYGFVLAMPATALLLTAALAWLPRWIDRRGGWGQLAAAMLLVCWCFALYGLLRVQAANLRSRQFLVGRGADSFLADGRGPIIGMAITFIEQNTTAQQTVVTLPEGLLINYLTRRTNPTPHLKFPLPEMIMYGEDVMVRDFESNPPDFVVVVHNSTHPFGRDYGHQLALWIRSRYEPVRRIGAMPFTSDDFGILILRRIADSDRAPRGGEGPVP